MNDLDLRTRLAALDPARDLPPIGDADRAALLARAASGPAPAPRRARAGLRIGVAAGLVVVGAAATVFALAQPVGAHRSADPGPTALVLGLPDDSSASCARLDDFAAGALARSTTAFLGTVEQVQGDRVALRVDDLYRGGPADTVVLDAPVDIEDATTFTVGEQVLVAAHDGEVLGCGLSAEASPALQRYYDAAF